MPILDGTVPAREWVLGSDGQHQARRLARQLKTFAGARVVTSSEAKAIQTGQVIAEELGTLPEQRSGLDEIHRLVMPILSSDQYEQLVRRVLKAPSKAIIGTESAINAERRFSQSLDQLVRDTSVESIIVVSHGIVISLFIRRHNDIDTFEVWKSLTCASGLLLDGSAYSIVDSIPRPASEKMDGA